MARCFGQPASDAGARTLNPYSYGFPVEIDIDASGVATPTEHYAMGRMALELELAYVMPDNKTVYMTDSRDLRRAPTPH